MALTPIEQVNLLIGNIPANVFYPLFSDEEIQQFLDLNNQNVFNAARMAAIAAMMLVSSFNTREITGDIHVYNEYGANYRKALQLLIDNPQVDIPNGLMPYAAGISVSDVCANNNDPDNVRPPLTQIKVCGGCGCDSCKCTPTASDPFSVCGNC